LRYRQRRPPSITAALCAAGKRSSSSALVFGSLRGMAHAGAQGDAAARVFALELAPTQLRIATHIAAGDGARRPREPEVALVKGDRITIAPYAKMGAER